MESNAPPIRILSGPCVIAATRIRLTHHVHQLEGPVGSMRAGAFADLKGTHRQQFLAREFFEPDREVRFAFVLPFTEPSPRWISAARVKNGEEKADLSWKCWAAALRCTRDDVAHCSGNRPEKYQGFAFRNGARALTDAALRAWAICAFSSTRSAFS